MVTTRRSNGRAASYSSLDPSPSSTTKTQTPAETQTAMTPSTLSAFLPTTLESALLLLHPLTLLMGSLFSHLSPSMRPPQNHSTYSAAHQSFYPAALAPSYFARKSNVFNVYFVKLGWGWTTLAFFTFTFSRFLRRRASASSTAQLLNAIARYTVATTIWLFTTQWFFGPALIDRNFSYTGGTCRNVSDVPDAVISPAKARIADPMKIATADSRLLCSAAGGVWHGGHDISGHVFLLVLGSGMLWLELLPIIFAHVRGLRDGRVIRSASGAVGEVGSAAALAETADDAVKIAANAKKPGQQRKGLAWPTVAALAVAVLSWWMLLMTAAFFHTWPEKFTGLVAAFTGLYVVYFLPRGVPAWRAVLGMPGM